MVSGIKQCGVESTGREVRGQFLFDFEHFSLLQPTLQLFHKVDLVLCCESIVKREEGANPSLTRNCNR